MFGLFILVLYVLELTKVKNNIIFDETIYASIIYLYSLGTRLNVNCQGILKLINLNKSHPLYEPSVVTLDETYYNINETRNFLLNQKTDLDKKLLKPHFDMYSKMYQDAEKLYNLIKNPEQLNISKN